MLQSIQKLKGAFVAKTMIQKRVAQCRTKIERGDPLVPSGFVGYVEKKQNQRGTLWNNLDAFPGYSFSFL